LLSLQKTHTLSSVRPDHGGRLELKLARASGTRAEYVLSLFTPEAELCSRVIIDAQGEKLELAAFEGGVPPAWLEGYAHALLRSVLRTKTSDGEWPRRLTRWRPAPRA
jgi:hypothetical protein